MVMKDPVQLLKNLLPPEDLPVVIGALRYDSLIWEQVGDPVVMARFSEVAGAQAGEWTPAALALSVLQIDATAESLRALPMTSLASDIRQRSVRAYEEMLRDPKPVASMEQAALLALALRERRRLKDSWQGLLAELESTSSGNRMLPLEYWNTPIAILYGLTPDPIELFSSILSPFDPESGDSQIRLIVHGLLSNPLAKSETVRILSAITAIQPAQFQISVLSTLKEMAPAEIVWQVSSNLGHSRSISGLAAKNDRPKKVRGSLPQGRTDPLADISNQELLARFFLEAGRPEEAVPALTAAEKAILNHQAEIYYQKSRVYSQKSDHEAAIQAIKKALELSPSSPIYRIDLADEYLRLGRLVDAQQALPTDSTEPRVLLMRSFIAKTTDKLPQARDYAQNASKNAALLNRDELHRLIEQQIDLDLCQEAKDLAAWGCGKYPSDYRFIDQLARAQLGINEKEGAVDTVQLAVALSPKDAAVRRLAADTFEAVGNWENCLEERRQVLALSENPALEDMHSFAASAISAGQPDEAIRISRMALAQNPEDGLAHTHLGGAAYQKADYPSAISEFSQATLLLPDDPRAWLGLSNSYLAVGDPQKCLETLRSASRSAPNNAEILVALGQAYLAQGTPSEALPALRRAAAISPSSPDLSLQLGNMLYDLGRLEEAQQVLERSRVYWPSHPGLALAEGKTQLSLGNIASALQALEIALHAEPADPEPYLLYAQSILELNKESHRIGLSGARLLSAPNVDAARQALMKSLELDPDNFEARVLMGEAQAASGMLEDALQTYLELSELDAAKTPRWNGRIHLGMGRVARDLGQMETSIAALQEAVQANPEDLEINQALAEAYYSANLTEEATIQARTALGMAPNSIDNLVWYSGLSLQMKEELDAINALEHAVEVAPERADLRLTLARVQMQLKDYPSARKSLRDIVSAEYATADEMRQAAEIFNELEDIPSAIACLEKSVELGGQPVAEIYARLAEFQARGGSLETAVDSAQMALEARPLDAGLHFLLGDLLSRQNQSESALSSFEQSLDLLEKSPHTEWVYAPADFSPVTLKLRVANLLKSSGDLRGALARAQEVVAEQPDSDQARLFAAELAHALLEDGLALSLSTSRQPDLADGEQSVHELASRSDPAVTGSLLSLQAELHMDNGADYLAEECLDQALELSPEDPRVLADRARLAARKGDFQTGGSLLEESLSHLNAGQGSDGLSRDSTLQIAEAALELQQWHTAMPLYAQVIRSAPDEPLPHFCLARALVRAAENQPAYKNLGALRHAPGDDMVSEARFQEFEREFHAVDHAASSPQVDAWYRRGLVAFHHQDASLLDQPHGIGMPDQVEDYETDQAVGGPSAGLLNDQLDGLFRRGVVQKDLEPEKALASAQAVVSQKPGHPLYQALYSSAALRNHNPSAALGAIQAALASWPDEPMWHAAAADIADQCNLPAETLEHWQAACALEPENAGFICALGKAYLKTGDIGKAIQTLEHSAALDPADADAWMSLGAAHRSNKSYTEALSAAEKAVRLSPGRVEPLAISGKIAFEAQQYELGLQRAQEILKIDPHNPQAVLLMAKAETSQGKPAQALQLIETALPSLRDPFEVLLERGRLIREVNGVRPALDAFQSLAKQYPESPDALAEYALALEEVGQKEVAEKTAQAALQLDPSQPDLHLLLGRIQHSAGQLDQAIYHLTEAAGLAPANVEIYLELGKTYADRREQTQALEVYQQAFAIAPEDYRAYYQAGLALKDCKDYTMAETMLRKSAELAPEDLNVRRQLAAIIAINLVHNPQEAPKYR